MSERKIQSVLISVYYKDGLEPIVRKLHALGVKIFSTGGTESFIAGLGIPVTSVESVTGYPSVFGGRVKTLHPKIFGGILFRREEKQDRDDQSKLEIPRIDLVIVDLYPFEDTVAKTNSEEEIIEKIDVGGIALIRAAAKNYNDVLICASRIYYVDMLSLLESKNGTTSEEDRKLFATRAFHITSHYDTAIFKYFNADHSVDAFKESISTATSLRYGENPHQQGKYFGDLNLLFEQLNGKKLSYNNLVDADAAISLIQEFTEPACAVIKHTNACGAAEATNAVEAWQKALTGDPVSTFGGIIIFNRKVDLQLAQSLHEIFFEVLIAPTFEPEALALLSQKKNRIILKLKSPVANPKFFKSILNGVIEQQTDAQLTSPQSWKAVTKILPTANETSDLLFAEKCVKHLKSNAIVLVKNRQLIGMGCGQTSRVDALSQAIMKAQANKFDLSGAVMASDAFFPFNDCVQIAHEAGIHAVMQPGGSVRDKDSIELCDQHKMAMVFTGLRHFGH